MYLIVLYFFILSTSISNYASSQDEELAHRLQKEEIDRQAATEADRELARRLQEEENSGGIPPRPPSPKPQPRPASPTLVTRWLQDSHFSNEDSGTQGINIGSRAGKKDRTDQYGNVYFPTVPFFHPYNPNDEFNRPGHNFTICLIRAELPPHIFKAQLPPFIRDAAPDLTEIYWVVQTNPWVQTAPILSRPHYWADPDAPYEGGHSFGATVHQRCFWPNGDRFYNADVQVSNHPGDKGRTAASPNANHIPELTRENQSFSFWSITDYKDRHAVTLHWFTNEEDSVIIRRAMEQTASTKELIQILLRSHLPPEFMTELHHLFK